VRICALARAHVAGRPNKLLVDGRKTRDRRRHHRENRVERHHGDLRHVVNAEPKHDDRQEGDFRHRKTDRDDRIEKPAHESYARHRRTERDAAAGGNEKARQRPIGGEAEVEPKIAGSGIGINAGNDGAEWGQHERGDFAATGKRFPSDEQQHNRDNARAGPQEHADAAGRPPIGDGCRRRESGLVLYSRHRSKNCIRT
jgi:hypothetical protein